MAEGLNYSVKISFNAIDRFSTKVNRMGKSVKSLEKSLSTLSKTTSNLDGRTKSMTGLNKAMSRQSAFSKSLSKSQSSLAQAHQNLARAEKNLYSGRRKFYKMKSPKLQQGSYSKQTGTRLDTGSFVDYGNSFKDKFNKATSNFKKNATRFITGSQAYLKKNGKKLWSAFEMPRGSYEWSKFYDSGINSADSFMQGMGAKFNAYRGMSFGEKLTSMNNGIDDLQGNLGKKLNKAGSYLMQGGFGVSGAIAKGVGGFAQISASASKLQRTLNAPFTQPIYRGVMDLMTPISSVNRGFSNWANTLQGVASGIYVLKNGMDFVASRFEKIDSLANDKARMGMIGGLVQEPTNKSKSEMVQDVQDIAFRTRQDYGTVSEFYSKLGINAGMSFKNIDQLSKFTESVGKTMELSGSSGTEKRSAMLQLQQALSSGRLQGDELTSILENAPVLANEIAKGMGVNKGELKELGQQYQLTTDKVIDAILKQGDEIDKAYANLPLTFDGLRNQIDIMKNKGFADFYSGVSDILNTDEIKALPKKLQPVFTKLGKGLANGVDQLGSGIKLMTSGNAIGGMQRLAGSFKGLSSAMVGITQGGITGKAIAGFGLLGAVAERSGTSVGHLSKKLENLATSTLEVNNVTIKTGIRNATSSAREFMQNFNIGQVAMGIGNNIQTYFDTFAEAGGAKEVIIDLGKFMGNLVDGITVKAPDVMGSANNLYGKIAEGLEASLGDFGTKLGEMVSTIVDSHMENRDMFRANTAKIKKSIQKGFENMVKEIDIGDVGTMLGDLLFAKDQFAKAIPLNRLVDIALTIGINAIKSKFEGNPEARIQSLMEKELKLSTNSKGSRIVETDFGTIQVNGKADVAVTENSKQGIFGKLKDKFKTWNDRQNQVPEITQEVEVKTKLKESQDSNQELERQLEEKSQKIKDLMDAHNFAEDVELAIEKIDTVLDDLATRIETDPEQFTQIGQNIIDSIMQGFDMYVDDNAENITNKFASMFENMDVSILQEKFGTLFQNLFSGDSDSGMFAGLTEQLQMAFTTAFEAMDVEFMSVALGNKIREGLEVAVENLDFGDQFVETFTQTGLEAGEGFGQGLEEGMATVPETVSTTLEEAVAVAESYKGQFTSVGKSFSEGIAEGILAGSGLILRAVDSVVAKAVARANDKLEINSPSKVMKRTAGIGYSEGIAVGILKGGSNIRKAVDRTVANMSKWTRDESLNNKMTFTTHVERIPEKKDKEDERELPKKIREEIKLGMLQKQGQTYVNNYVSPVVEFKDIVIRETADTKEIIKTYEQWLQEEAFRSGLIPS